MGVISEKREETGSLRLMQSRHESKASAAQSEDVVIQTDS
jgi:hypothetical protein